MKLKKPNNKPLALSFYKQNTETVARNLLGKILWRKEKGELYGGLIVETEAYLGVKDPGCHTFGGKATERVKSMYLDGGHAYVYQIYGMYYCLNIVTRSSKHPEAVLIRAVEPIAGVAAMQRNRKLKKKLASPKKIKKENGRGSTHSLNLSVIPEIAPQLTNGPGKLCQALNINKNCDGLKLNSSQIWIEDHGIKLPKTRVVIAPRIGIDYAGEAALWPLRYYIKDSTFVSKRFRFENLIA